MLNLKVRYRSGRLVTSSSAQFPVLGSSLPADPLRSVADSHPQPELSIIRRRCFKFVVQENFTAHVVRLPRLVLEHCLIPSPPRPTFLFLEADDATWESGRARARLRFN